MNWFPVKYFPLEKDLSELTAYLRQRGLVHRITEESGQQLLAVVDEQVIASLQEFLNEYEQGRVEFSVAPSASLPVSHSQMSHVIEDLKSAPVAVTLILLSVVGALLTQTAMGNQWLPFFMFLGFDGRNFLSLTETLASGEIWRLLTPAFIHFGLFHVLFNSLWVWDFGRRLEYLLGWRHFLLFFVLTGVASNIVQFLWSGSAIFGGMSGVVYALVGFIAVRQRIAPHPWVTVPPALIGFMLFWLVLCMTGVVDYFISGSVANAAHVGGLVAGVLYALATRHFYHR